MNRRLSKGRALLGTTLTAAVFLSGCGSDLDQFVATNTTNIIAPVAVNDAFNALGNATVNQAAAGVLANDAINGGSISSYDAVGNQGGTIVLNADGSFAYTPVFGFVGQETFAYTLSNNSGSSTATVTMTSTGSGFFVDNTAAPGGNGSQASPFNTLAAAINAASAGDTIYVSRGDGTDTGLSGAIALPAGVDLIGEGSGLVVAQTIEPQGQPPVITGPITCGGDNTISGLTIDGAPTDAIVISNVGDITVTNTTIRNFNGNAVDIENATGTNTFSGNTFELPTANSNLDFIFGTQTDTDGSLVFTNNTFSNDNATDVQDCVGIEIDELGGSSIVDVTFTGNSVVGANPNDLAYGFYVETYDSAQATVTASNNTFTNLEYIAIETTANESSQLMVTINDNIISNIDDVAICIDDNDLDDVSTSGTISGNTISNTEEDAMEIGVNNGTMTISGNVISDVDDDSTPGFGLNLRAGEDNGTFVVSNNNISDAVGGGIYYIDSPAAPSNNGDVKIALRDNTISTVSDSVTIVTSVGGNICLEATGNTVSSDMLFVDDNSAGTFEVEQLGVSPFTNFTTVLNTFNNGASVQQPVDPVTSVADGFCAIP